MSVNVISRLLTCGVFAVEKCLGVVLKAMNTGIYDVIPIRGFEMTKYYHPNCNKIPDIGSLYCLQHRIENIKEFRKMIYGLTREDKEKLK